MRLRTPPTNLDFSGFRVLLRNDQGDLRELAVFQGASFFRSAAPGQTLGVTSRGLSIRTGDPRGEEFPLFRAVWIEKASVADNALTISALLNSDSVAGAYRFTIHPGDATIIDVECSLFPRASIDVFRSRDHERDRLFSPLDRRGDDDVRDAAAEVTGLQMLTGRGEWIWRPVANRANLQISEFVDQNPKGFGFLQRHRAFDDFYDFDSPLGAAALAVGRADRRLGRRLGGAGRNSLRQRNRPEHRRLLAAQGAPGQGPAGRFRLSPVLVLDAAVTSGRRRDRRIRAADAARAPGRRRFLVEFRGDAFADPARVAALTPNLSVTPGKVVAQKVYPAADRKSCYVQFDIDPGGETACEIRLTLDFQGAPQTETWLYRWTQ